MGLVWGIGCGGRRLYPFAFRGFLQSSLPRTGAPLDVMMMDDGFWDWVCDVIGRGLMLIFWTSHGVDGGCNDLSSTWTPLEGEISIVRQQGFRSSTARWSRPEFCNVKIALHDLGSHRMHIRSLGPTSACITTDTYMHGNLVFELQLGKHMHRPD
jgi:hypothetical protein